MKLLTPLATALALAAMLLAGCATRSISNSSYDAGRGRGSSQVGGYRGELSEFDVIGVSKNAQATEEEIRAALAAQVSPRLTPQSRVLLIQSGADYPDAPMFEQLRRETHVDSFTGKPPSNGYVTQDQPSYSKTLRLAAARGGYDKIVCYWGVLESEHTNETTKVVSWIPLAGYLVPDQQDSMRIRLKAVVMDVASGQWTFVSPPPILSRSFSSIVSRRNTDQDLVQKLKEAGYRELVSALVPKRDAD